MRRRQYQSTHRNTPIERSELGVDHRLLTLINRCRSALTGMIFLRKPKIAFQDKTAREDPAPFTIVKS
jgi:hypothetical protein